MKNLVILLIIGLISISYLTNTKVSCRRARDNDFAGSFEEDEFKEFDTVTDEELNEELSDKPKKKLDQVKLVKESRASDFSGFDNNNEDETIENADDEDFEDPSDDDDFKKNNFDKKPKPDDSKVKVESPNANTKQKVFSSSSFNLNNPDDLDMEEFEHFVDEEEFEGFEQTQSSKQSSQNGAKDESNNKRKQHKNSGASDSSNKMPNLKIADVPMHLMSRGNWSSYIWEIVLLFLISIYLINYIYGKSKNYRLVTTWYQSHRVLLERQFAVVGDDGTTPELPSQKTSDTESSSSFESGTLIKESENSYGLWCTGRQMCDGINYFYHNYYYYY